MVAKDGNDRLKLAILLLAEEDEKTRFASAGALAILTSGNEDICKKIHTKVRYLCVQFVKRACSY